MRRRSWGAEYSLLALLTLPVVAQVAQERPFRDTDVELIRLLARICSSKIWAIGIEHKAKDVLSLCCCQ